MKNTRLWKILAQYFKAHEKLEATCIPYYYWQWNKAKRLRLHYRTTRYRFMLSIKGLDILKDPSPRLTKEARDAYMDYHFDKTKS